MKYLILLTAISFNSLSATCEEYFNQAIDIMTKRQAGQSIIETLKLTNDGYNKEMIMAAFNVPVMGTAKYKERRAIQFGNRMYLLCEKVKKKGSK